MGAEILDQTRLDVSEKSRSNLFSWRGQFTPQFVEYLLDASRLRVRSLSIRFAGAAPSCWRLLQSECRLQGTK